MIRRRMPNYKLALYLVVGGVLYWLLDRFAMLYLDDFLYCFQLGDGFYVAEPVRHINTLGDAVVSQTGQYLHVNGRFVTHTLTQWFAGVGGIKLFVWCCTGMFMLLLYDFYRLTTGRDVRTSFATLCIALPPLMLYCIPKIGPTLMGGYAFTINYLWGGALTLFCFALYLTNKQNAVSGGAKWLLLPIWMIFASMNESFSIPISGAMLVGWILQMRQKRRWTWPTPLVLGFWLGTLTVLCAPGSISRCLNGIGTQTSLLYTICKILFHLRAFYVMVVLMLLTWALRGRAALSELVRRDWALFTAMGIAILFALVVAFSDTQQLLCVEFLSIVVSIQLFSMIWHPWPRCARIFVSILLIGASGYMYVEAYQVRRVSWQLRREMDRKAEALPAAGGWIAEPTFRRNLNSAAHPLGGDYLSESLWSADLYSRLHSASHRGDAIRLYPEELDRPELFSSANRLNGIEAYTLPASSIIVIKEDGARPGDWIENQTAPASVRDRIRMRLFRPAPLQLQRVETPTGPYLIAYKIPGERYENLTLKPAK